MLTVKPNTKPSTKPVNNSLKIKLLTAIAKLINMFIYCLVGLIAGVAITILVFTMQMHFS